MGQTTINQFHRICLNGVVREGEQLQHFCLQELDQAPEWLAHIYEFILEWLSPEESVEAYTSGSTGTPKKVYLQKKHMIASALKTNDYFGLTANHAALLCLSPNYIAGKMMLVRAFVGGFNLLCVEPSGAPLKQLSTPVDFVAMVSLQAFNSISDFNSDIKHVIIGGGAVSSELKAQLRDLPTRFYETYGMTETVSHVAIREIGEKESFFRAMSNVLFEQDDRLCLKIIAPDICSGDIITNDIVELIGKKEFKFLGRYDNVINSGGVKIIPEEVEKKLEKVLHVPFLISSLPHKQLGEQVVLVVEEGQDLSLPDFSLYLLKYQIPKKVVFISNIPLTDTGKVRRKVLKNMIVSANNGD
jgi:O-succinylbenzoic acid--CoA ligase